MTIVSRRDYIPEWRRPRPCRWEKCHSGPNGTLKVFIPKIPRQRYCCNYHRVAACEERARTRPVEKIQTDVHNKINSFVDLVLAEADKLRKELSIPNI